MDFDLEIRGMKGLQNELEEWESSLPNGEVVWAVKTEVHYAIYQEFGTSHHPPQPYMRPAVQRISQSGEIQRILGDADNLDDGIQEIAMEVRDEAKDFAPVRTGRLRDSIETEKVK
ncbi:HK97-gp10 family putative phage morphogenesis protein [Halomicrococcus gelatinilyticus]|uniref:HK97-gp10 family putative phage morphogenesis protein n=1 Tax=Halomicrococcus gelatinilyticus TaxID=1702103 RepID=UPI002E1221E8